MADSTEQKIVTRALAVAAAINGSAPYQTTLGSTINDAGATVQSIGDSRVNWQQAELPALSIFQGPVEPDDIDNEAQKVLRKMNLICVGQLERRSDASAARKFISDIMRMLRAAGDEWIVSGTPLAQYTEEGPHRINYDESTYEITGVQVEANIFYIASNLDMEN